MTKFTVPGNPLPKMRPRFARGRTFTARDTSIAEEIVRAYAVNARAPKLIGPVQLSVHFYRQDATRCDLDNLVKLVLDALNRIAYRDDAQIVNLIATKHVDPRNPRTEVAVGAAPED